MILFPPPEMIIGLLSSPPPLGGISYSLISSPLREGLTLLSSPPTWGEN